MEDVFLYNKIASLPDDLKIQVEVFIDFLTWKDDKKVEKIHPQFGSGQGMFIMKPGFDEPLEDFKEYM